MPPPGASPIPLSAPGLIGPNSIFNPPWAGARSAHRARARPFSHVRLEIDLRPDGSTRGPLPALQRFEALFRERKIVESADLVALAVQFLHALSARGFRRVDHWEVAPGGWLPPPGPGPGPGKAFEPVGALFETLSGPDASSIAGARTFLARLSDGEGNRLDLAIRRVHRQRRHSVSLDLWGSWTQEQVHGIVGAIAARLPVARTEVVAHQYGSTRRGR